LQKQLRHIFAPYATDNFFPGCVFRENILKAGLNRLKFCVFLLTEQYYLKLELQQ